MIITLIRHAEVDQRYRNCYNGHIDIGLSERGRQQSNILAARFSNSHFDAIYCSDLQRAVDTLLPIKLTCQPIYTGQLREKSWGRHEGMAFDAICQRDRLHYEHFEQWINLLDGERFYTFRDRVRHFFLDHLTQHSYRQVMVMTHAGVIHTLYSIIKNITLEDAYAIHLPYAAHTTLETEQCQFGTVIPVNDCF